MISTRFFAAIVLFALIASCATVDTEANIQKSEAHYKIGVGYLYDNKIQAAFVEFQHAYELNANNKEVLNAIGIIYLQHFDDIAKAIDFFQKAVSVDPDYSEAYNNLGYANAKLDRFEAALPYYRKAVSNLVYTTPEKAYVNMGRAYYRLGRYEEAVASYREAIRRSPNLDLPYFGLALCYNSMKKYGEASSALSTAIILNASYKGNTKHATEDLTTRRAGASGYEQKDLGDYLDILQY
jgi:tetratricopeptide (TPR) repeat protein